MNKQTLSKAVMLILFAACGVFLGYYGAPAIDLLNAPDQPSILRFLIIAGLFLGLVGSILLQFIIHEAGHLVFGLLSGYRFASFRIGHLMLIRQNGRIRIKRLSLAGTGGQCLLIPPELMNGRLPVVRYLMGGTILNLVSAPFFWSFHVLSPGLPFLSFLFLLLACIGVIVALSNGLPMRTKMVDNDGYLVLSLRKSETARRCFWVQMKINELITNGVRLKEMPEDWFVMPPEEALKNTLCSSIGVFICNRATDQLDFAEAERVARYLLERAKGLSGLNRSILVTELAFRELIGLNRQDVLDPLYTKEFRLYLKSMARYPAVIRLQYAHALLAKRDTAEADKWLAAFEKTAKTYPYPCDIESEREIMAVVQKTGQHQLKR